MGRKSSRTALKVTEADRRYLGRLAGSRIAPRREVERAQILLSYANAATITEIHRALHVSRPTIYKCIDKALAAGVKAGLKDTYHRPREPVIGEPEKAFIINLACQKPKDLGLAAERWTVSALARYTRAKAPSADLPALVHAGKATIWRILNNSGIQPHRVQYYLEKRDPQLEAKRREVVLVYQEVALENAQVEQALPSSVITVSLDEKPGVQAIGNIAADLPPQPGHHPAWGRDHEYVRHGTLSILAALDLHDGHIIAQVHERHRSREYIELLKELDAYYPPECTLCIVLDNHSSPISRETMAYLATRPNRFTYIHTPKHGSWLNLIERAFSRMARSFLRPIRVDSEEELKRRILQGVDEMNAVPVVMRWRKYDLELV